MSRFLMLVLLATTASPAIAIQRDRSDTEARSERSSRAERPATRANRSQARSERPQPRVERSERVQVRAERPGQLERAERAAPVVMERRSSRALRADDAERLAPRRRSRAPAAVQVEPAATAEADTVRERVVRERRRSSETIERRNLRRAPVARRIEEVRAGEDLVQPTRPLPRVLDRNRPDRVSRAPMPGTEPPPATALSRETRRAHRWDTDWRRDRRYDWHNHRRRHRSLFRLGFYYDPFGWSYRRYGIGWRLWPSYYGRSFWLHDPWMYRLPYAPPGYRWIRYYDDAILIDTWDGRIVDIIHNFFW